MYMSKIVNVARGRLQYLDRQSSGWVRRSLLAALIWTSLSLIYSLPSLARGQGLMYKGVDSVRGSLRGGGRGV
jgi:hypothetical protein